MFRGSLGWRSPTFTTYLCEGDAKCGDDIIIELLNVLSWHLSPSHGAVGDVATLRLIKSRITYLYCTSQRFFHPIGTDLFLISIFILTIGRDHAQFVSINSRDIWA